MGLPPSSSGSFQVNVSASLVMSEGSRRVGGPGGSTKENQYTFCEILHNTNIFDILIILIYHVTEHSSIFLPNEYLATMESD